MSKTKTKETKTPEPLYSSPLLTRDGELLPSRGRQICRWIEANLVCGEGDWYGQALKLREFQRRFIWRLYEYHPKTGRRRYKRGLWGMGKGNGKTPIAGAIGAAELAGPFAPPYPHVMVAAASLQQANLVFGDMSTAMKESPRLKPFVEPYDLEILLKGRPGLAERIAAAVGTNDGPRCTALLADEVHEWIGRLKRTWIIVNGAVAKRQDAFALGITTAGIQAQMSVAEDLYAYGRRVASGEIVDDEFLFEWYEGPKEDGEDLENPEHWLRAVEAANPAVGDFNSLESIRSRFDGAMAIPRHEFERYHLNRWVASGDLWLPGGAWDRRAQPEKKVPKGTEVALAFSGTYTAEYAALVGCTIGGHVFVVDIWEKPGGVVSRAEVNAVLTKAMKRYKVFRVACNPPGWDADIESWAETWGQDVVILFEVRRRHIFAEACRKFYTAVVDGGLSHDGEPRLGRHLGNVVPKETTEGTYVTEQPDSPTSAAKAAILAFEEASVPPARSAYEDHGLVVV